MTTFEDTEMDRLIRSSINDIVKDFGEEYWREIRTSKRFPTEFWDRLADDGWLGIAIPQEYGGQGLGMQEMVTVIEEVGRAGGWPAGLSFVLTPVFGGETLVAHGSREQKERWLPRIVKGDAKWALGVTEPDAGLNTLNLSTSASRDGSEWVIEGRKMWISGAADADRITLLARTLSRDEANRPSHGYSVFLVDPDKPNLDYDEIDVEGYFPDKTYNIYLDGVRVDESELVGTVHEGLPQLFDTLNVERMTTAACCSGTGLYALDQAADYARDREVFDAPIGSHQAIQHPIADALADLECARLMNQKAAWRYDESMDAGTASNIANLKCAESAWHACEAAMSTFGGMSISREMGISSMWSYIRHLRIAPVSEEMILNYLAERELDLPRSY